MKKLTIFLAFLLFVAFQAAAQVQISGTVTGAEDGLSIPGVSIVVKGSPTIGTTTDIDGKYNITVPGSAEALVFSFVGMTTQEQLINGRSVIDVQMESEAFEMEQVVVTAIGISREAKALGYSVVSVSEEQLEQKTEPDMLRNLQGKVPGVDIASTSGAPGSSTRITIRGNSSFYGNNQPLFVVDGIPYSNQEFVTSDLSSGGGAYSSGISTLDPNNIASMSVLKGAAAAALYGSRASNGVIVIKTKTGSADISRKGLEVTYKTSYAVEQISNLPDYQDTYGNGVDFAYANANGSWGPRFDSLDSIPAWPMYLEAYPELFSSTGMVEYKPQPDNVKDLFDQGSVFENSIAISGGNENSALTLTVSSLNNDGYIPNSSFDRRSVNIGGVTELENGLKVDGNFAYTQSTQVGGIFGNNQSTAAGTASSFARTLWLGRAWDIAGYPTTNPITGDNLTPNGPGQFDNPLWSWEHNTITTEVDRMVANVGLSYDLTDYLGISYKVGSNTFIQRRQEIVDQGSRAYDGNGGIIDDDVWTNELESNLLLTFDKDINEDINIAAIAGWNVNQRIVDRQSFFGQTIVAPGVYDLDNTQSVTPNGGTYSKRRLWGLLADVSVAYKNWLYVNMSGRNDWSSTLPTEENSYFYPAISASFIFTQALGIENNILNLGKVRAGWGKVGNDAGVYSIYNTYNVRTDYFPFSGQSSQTIPDVSYSPDLSPEFTTELEFGTDLAFFNNRIRLDLTWYNKVSTDQIVTINVPASTGYRYKVMNAGEITNKGWEVGLDLTPVQMADNGLKWNIFAAFNNNVSEVTALPDGYDRITLEGLFGDPMPVFEVGQPYGILRGSVSARDDEGNLLIDPGTGTLILNPELQTIGDPNPDFKLGVTNALSYKGLTFSFLFNYTHGGDLWSNSIVSLLGRGVTKDTEDREHTFVIPGVYGNPNTVEAYLDEDGNTIPNNTQVTMNDLYFGDSFAINASGEWGVYDATVLRLSDVSLAYQIPDKYLSKLPFGGVTVAFSGKNLWFYTPNLPEHVNLDPELNGYGASNVQGIEYSNQPSVRRYGVSLTINL
ncbi:MAG: SusC/RagA family TonB-linked outer membrane protein [Bacteroidales bacterium]|nr:SusC/RagA family TonB-linked outer membrane protein [Bacteroidales bacterium]